MSTGEAVYGPGKSGGFGCTRCWPAEAEAAWEARNALAVVADVIDEPHFHVMLLACPRCGQRFVSVFTETIDWADGDDPQAWCLSPVTTAEAAGLVRPGAAFAEPELDAFDPARRSLRVEHPKGGPRRVFWATGLSIGLHD